MKLVAKRRGFTLIELLVVISIIALLISILLPALTAARRTALTAQCQSNMRQHGIGATVYHVENRGILPHNEAKGEPAMGGYITNYKDSPLKARGWWSDFYDFAVSPGWFGGGGGDMYDTPSNYRKKVLKQTILHCPQMMAFGDQRYHDWPGGRTGQAWSDYVLNRNLGGVAEVRTDTVGTPLIPMDRMLYSDRMWFMEGVANRIVDNGATYWTKQYARLSQDTSTWGWSGFHAVPTWWRTHKNYTGRGHPGDAANVLYGDGHVAPMVRQEMLDMSASQFSHFAGYKWYKD